MNQKLPSSIYFSQGWKVDSSFNVIHSALWKHYRYLLYRRGQRSPLYQDRAWVLNHPLDEEAMKNAASVRDAAIALGAERMTIAQITTGQYTGDWLAMTRASDMATLDKVLRGFRETDEYQAMMASGNVTIVARNYMEIPEGF